MCVEITMKSKHGQVQLIPALKVLGGSRIAAHPARPDALVGCAPAPIASSANPRSQPTKRNLATAATSEVT